MILCGGKEEIRGKGMWFFLASLDILNNEVIILHISPQILSESQIEI